MQESSVNDWLGVDPKYSTREFSQGLSEFIVITVLQQSDDGRVAKALGSF